MDPDDTPHEARLNRGSIPRIPDDSDTRHAKSPSEDRSRRAIAEENLRLRRALVRCYAVIGGRMAEDAPVEALETIPDEVVSRVRGMREYHMELLRHVRRDFE